MSVDAVRRSGCLPASLIRVLLVLVAVLAIPLGLPASVRADTGPDTGPDTVTVGVFINDLQDIDLASENFTVDFYLWMRWKNPAIDPSLTIEAMNSEGTQNTTSSATGGVSGEPLYDAPLAMPDGSKYQVLRFQGVFSRKMSLEKYPFDTQVLEMVFEDKRSDASRLEFVRDRPPVTVNDGPAMSIPGYVLGEPKMTRSSMMPLTVMSLSAMSGWALRACSLPRFLKMVRM